MKLLIISFNLHSDFRSHILNRDVWKKDEIAIMMEAFFVLLQVESKPMEGLADLYKVVELPSLVVVDPRTGRKVRDISFESFENEMKAKHTLLDLLERHPIDSFYKPTKPNPEPIITTPTASPTQVSSTGGGEFIAESSNNSTQEQVVTEVNEEEMKKVEAAHETVNSTLADLHAARRLRMAAKNNAP
eukprot:GHVH01008629.1.p1 GENE.GHVH01008629.1~~GHVH01008629.1.p1  ORF type:complete len:188 (+),score=36.17 GHVH01008629.1:99-662(+)